MSRASDILSKWEDLKEEKIYAIKDYNYELSLALKSSAGVPDLPKEAAVYEKNLKQIITKWDITVDILIDNVEKDLIGPYKVYNVVDEDIIGRYIDFPKDSYTADDLLNLLVDEFNKDLITLFSKSDTKTVDISDKNKTEYIRIEIESLCNDLTDVEKDELIKYIQKQFNSTGTTLEENLSELNIDDLLILKDLIEEYIEIVNLSKVHE